MSLRRAAVALVVICAVALLANAFWVDSKTRPAEAREGGQIMDTSVVAANVRVEGAGPTLVLLHGCGAAIDWWDGIAPQLALDHRVIRLDLIGHGGTEAPSSGYSIERQGELVSAVLDKLGVDRFTVISHSMGGEVATALAELKPERIDHMILIDSPAAVGTTFTILSDAFFYPVIGQALSHFESDRTLRHGLAQGFAPGFPVPEKFVADLRQLPYNSFRSAHEESIAYRTAKPTYERLAALRPVPPLLAISGTRDAIVPPEQAALFGKVPGAKVAMIEGAGHSPMVEAPAKTLELIQEFLHSTP
jgi:pimeloyl-ACP methyl ester carboxylesterase